MTNETKCVLAQSCAFAGDPTACNDMCDSYNAVHSQSGRHTLADLPAEYRLVTLANSPARKDQAEHYEVFADYVKTFDRHLTGERIRSLYLVSVESGTGKTTSAAALLNEYIRANYVGSLRKGARPPKRPAYFFDVESWQTLFSRIHMASGDRKEALAAEFDAVRSRAIIAKFAVFDDIATRETRDGFRAQLHGVINERVTSGLPTVYTSNVEVSDLTRVFDARLADRIREQCFERYFKGESKRGVRR